MHKPKKYSALDEDFQRSQREQPVRDHRNILGEFCVFTFSKYLSWAAIVQSRQAKVVIANQAHPADVLLSCWRNIVWRSSLPPSSLCSSTASFSGQGSDRRYGDTRSARGWSCPGLTTASFPSQVSQWQCKGCFYGLMHPLPLSLVIFIKNPAFQFFVLFLIFPARNLKREQKKKKKPRKDQTWHWWLPALTTGLLRLVDLWPQGEVDSRRHPPTYCTLTTEFIANVSGFLSDGWKTATSSLHFGLCCWKRD